MNEAKPVLAIETSSDLCSVALYSGAGENFCFDIRQKHIHSEKLIPMIDTILGYAGKKVGDLSHIAVSMGPGSFTGLRIGLSAAKGIAFGGGIPICPVPTFDAFAYSLAGILAEGSEFVIARNVNVDELYCSRYAVAVGSYKTVTPLDIIKKSGFEAYIKKDDLIFGNYGVKSDMHKTDTDALSIAKWSLKFGKPLLTEDFDFLEPDYLKKFEGRKLK